MYVPAFPTTTYDNCWYHSAWPPILPPSRHVARVSLLHRMLPLLLLRPLLLTTTRKYYLCSGSCGDYLLPTTRQYHLCHYYCGDYLLLRLLATTTYVRNATTVTNSGKGRSRPEGPTSSCNNSYPCCRGRCYRHGQDSTKLLRTCGPRRRRALFRPPRPADAVPGPAWGRKQPVSRPKPPR